MSISKHERSLPLVSGLLKDAAITLFAGVGCATVAGGGAGAGAGVDAGAGAGATLGGQTGKTGFFGSSGKSMEIREDGTPNNAATSAAKAVGLSRTSFARRTSTVSTSISVGSVATGLATGSLPPPPLRRYPRRAKWLHSPLEHLQQRVKPCAPGGRPPRAPGTSRREAAPRDPKPPATTAVRARRCSLRPRRNALNDPSPPQQPAHLAELSR
mmetsp:Transcript_83217/g.240425  ORF Transcript_83217/g.240425 Transcript_83217/m.240425 type:complete len:213 (-) Transcript_83217:324-962(-)